MTEKYITGSGQKMINVHSSESCKGYPCVIHHPSDHIMKDFPTHWRGDRQLMERTCPHGIGHPDPDHIAYTERIHGATRAHFEWIHGCDGCCTC